MHRYRVAGVQESQKRLRKLLEEDSGLLLPDGPVFLLDRERVGVGEDDEDLACDCSCTAGHVVFVYVGIQLRIPVLSPGMFICFWDLSWSP